MTKIKIDNAVDIKIREIQQYIVTNFSAHRAALKVRKEILIPIRSLQKFPDSGNFISNVYGDIKTKYQNYRRLIAGHYIILYLYDDTSDICFVDFIFDSRTDYLSELQA
ncbi:MAG: type II toxin-antitoxin system RelE/ParE family toxin [Streptococcaceae bacterium]|jgi:plasmid stabilization system protein ParE|nr:type II toxin-antitoxin system RelE/ParE family toxin [Streptococcaceae bacterium]